MTKEEKKISKRVWKQEARKKDPYYKPWDSLSRSIRADIGKIKNKIWLPDIVGYSKQIFGKHIESLLEKGMSWDNYGKKFGEWNIDHIIPRAFFYKIEGKTLEAAKHANTLQNLRPMWHRDNRRKGKTISLLEIEYYQLEYLIPENIWNRFKELKIEG